VRRGADGIPNSPRPDRRHTQGRLGQLTLFLIWSLVNQPWHLDRMRPLPLGGEFLFYALDEVSAIGPFN
jgi:hypothetical protein